jgi:hypothetical protein
MGSTITCPNCKTEIEITQVISDQLRASIRTEVETELNSVREQIKGQEDKLVQQQKQLAKRVQTIDKEVNEKLAAQQQLLEQKIHKQAQEALAVELKDRDEQLKELREQVKIAQEKELDIRKREREVNQLKSQVEQEKHDLEQILRKELADQRAKISKQAEDKAMQKVAIELKDRDTELAELRDKVKESDGKELAFLKEKRQLEEKLRSADLEVARRTRGELDKVRQATLREADEQHQLKLKEKDQQIEGLRKHIDDLKRKAEQGSQQAQGEVMEIALEDLLKGLFPGDSIEPVPKGIKGADVMQRVHDESGMECGVILWESKRTKNWAKDWLPKVRDDLREVKASCAVIVSEALPDQVRHFGQIDGVWIGSWSSAHGVALVLRDGIIRAAKSRRALEGQHTKMEIVYNYLASQEFYNRVSGIVEAFRTMQNDVAAEKRTFERQWAKREKQLQRALINTCGLYGDLQGIIGSSLREIEGMSLPTLEANDASESNLLAEATDPDVEQD